MEAILHILGLCPDSAGHLNLLNILQLTIQELIQIYKYGRIRYK